jgi:natural product precursor
MKQLKKLKLNEHVDLLNDQTMKLVRGGDYAGYAGGSCYISCKDGSTRDTSVTVTSCNDNVWPCGYRNTWSCCCC